MSKRSSNKTIYTTHRTNEYTNYTFSEYIIPIPKIYGKWKTDGRKCERSNHIPHRTPTNSNRREWHNAYLAQLIDMYFIVINTINEMYPKCRINWDENEKIFHNLSRLIYHCSSKYISPYVD